MFWRAGWVRNRTWPRLGLRACSAQRSPPQSRFLALVAKGKSNKEIGAVLSISEGTVRVHASNLLAKLRCSGRAQAVSEAIRRGIIEVE